MTSKKFNQEMTESLTEDEFVDRFIYLTNKHRGEHCSERKLRNAYRSGNVATLIKRLDPTLYYTT